MLVCRFEETPVAFLTSSEVELQVHEGHMAWLKALSQMRLYPVNMCDGDHKKFHVPIELKDQLSLFSPNFY